MAPHSTRSAHFSPDNASVTNSAVQLGVIVGFAIVVMLLVLWRR
jgi:hypothetical protein